MRSYLLRRLLCLLPGLTLAPTLLAQSPWLIPFNLTPVYDGSVDLGDFDADGDLDLLLTGREIIPFSVGGFTTAIYTNDEDFVFVPDPTPGVDRDLPVPYKLFQPLNENLIPVFQGSAKWGDADGDGDLDVLLSGLAEVITPTNRLEVPTTVLYDHSRNGRGEHVFTPHPNLNLPGVFNGEVDWGDFDGDGDQDFVISGATRSSPPYNPITRLYGNEGGTFTEVPTSLPGVFLGATRWVDYDGDADLDLSLLGDTGNGHFITRLYRNDGGTFTDAQANLPGLAFGSLDWGDYDGDVDQDLVLTGARFDPSLLRGFTRVYRNDAGTFTDTGAAVPPVMQGVARWGDWDGDGLLDLVVAGYDELLGSGMMGLYRYQGGTFAPLLSFTINTGFSDLLVRDYNGDGDVDLLMIGLVEGKGASFFFMNRRFTECTPVEWVPRGEVQTCFL
jgi:hypothetical protein